MLLRLSIKNYAIIESVDLHFDKGLNIITGETGAGKSILMGALGLILGKRADTSVLRNTSEKCYVEAIFNINNKSLSTFFEEQDIDFQEETIIRREINAQGKSRAFINDQPVNLEILKALSSKLVDIHAQQETASLMENDFYLDILDGLSKNLENITNYKSLFQKYKSLSNQYNQLKKNDLEQKKEKDFLQFQFDEINVLKLNPTKDSTLQQELELLENGELIKLNLLKTVQHLDADDHSVLSLLRENNRLLNNISSFSNEIKDLKNRIENCISELTEIEHIANQIADNTEHDTVLIAEITERLDSINRLMQKHACTDVYELQIRFEALDKKLQKIDNDDEALHSLEKQLSEQKDILLSLGLQISEERKKQIPTFEVKVSDILKEIGMPYGYIELQLNKNENNFMPNGIDEIKLLFSPNKGIAAKSLDQVGSGGEKSRLMLAIKSLVAESGALPTLIFDEIDTGISGEVAQKVALVFKNLTKKHQLISITHLPQIAAKANKHFFVYKDHNAKITETKIKELNEEGRINEIAIMLSGAEPSDAAIQNAKDLISR